MSSTNRISMNGTGGGFSYEFDFKETLLLVIADHGHGFDAMGSVDTKYLAAQNVDCKKRDAVSTYQNCSL
jgi:alkaline phosphatase